MMQPPALLEVDQLTMAYPDGFAIDGVSFVVHESSVHAILGEDGAGKTTLAKCLIGAIATEKTSGHIRLDGKLLVLGTLADGIHHGVVIVPSKISVFDKMSVADNIMVARWQQSRRFALSRRSTESEAAELLSRWGLELDLGASVRAMNALQQRQLMLARGLAASPRLLILDEPLTGIAGHHAASHLLLVIRRLAERGATCLYLTRRPAEAMQIAQTITVLRDGAVAGTWERITFDEAELTAAMKSQRLGDTRPAKPDDDFAEPAGPLGPIRNALERWIRPGS
jgi:ABC-type sugar transport system ATPase subunit